MPVIVIFLFVSYCIPNNFCLSLFKAHCFRFSNVATIPTHAPLVTTLLRPINGHSTIPRRGTACDAMSSMSPNALKRPMFSVHNAK